MRKLSILLLSAFVALQVNAQQKANYALAAKFSPKKLEKMLFTTTVDPHWLKTGERFWYMYQTSEGKVWWLVDAAKGSKTLLFDNDKMAADITRIVKDPFDGKHLPIDRIKFVKNETAFQFEVKSTEEIEKKDTTKKGAEPTKEKKSYFFEYNLQTAQLTELKDFQKPKDKLPWATLSPDGKTVFFSKQNNLWWMDTANYRKAQTKEDDSTIVETQITTDGVEDFSYGGSRNETNVEKEKNAKKRKSVFLYWSPDGKKFVLTRSDERQVKDLWVINSVAEPRPTLETYKYQMPGEKEAPIRYVYLFDLDSKKSTLINTAAFKDQEVGIWAAPAKESTRDDENRVTYWLGTNEHFLLSRTSRDLKKIDICRTSVATGETKALIEERFNTYVEIRRPELINGGKEIIHWSERDGWGHFYLYDENGKLIRQITSGPWHAEGVEGVDEAARIMYFTANEKEKNQNPYYNHLYRVNLDGSNLKLLNPGNFDNQVGMGDSHKFFINNFSRVNTIPASVLFDNNGKQVMKLDSADFKQLFAAGYKFPEPFTVKADDGITDLYGVMYKPYDFDSTKKYPLIEYVYPGPQTEAVNAAFGRGMDRTDRLAQFGFIVVTVGNRGGHPNRSKWYHTYGYGNLRDYGLADKKAAAEKLADRYPFIDINRVGIHGHSGGGFMSTAAMLVYPDFFKVAVSSAGNHENNIYNRWWSEKHHGVKEVISAKGDTSFLYSVEKNPELAKNLKGRLMLSHGDIDNNVHPANTIRMVNALIKANKRFEYVSLPGQRHAYGDMTEYFFWKMGDYFSTYLLGNQDLPVDMVEMQREVEQSGNKKRN
ncbi:MAG TPA: DPP IV N-terminal domain-containing protein [Phnomibacter sp.]|nr:DPP IV N-terminal domain-containing protein [Phnomibacter sp.]